MGELQFLLSRSTLDLQPSSYRKPTAALVRLHQELPVEAVGELPAVALLQGPPVAGHGHAVGRVDHEAEGLKLKEG